MKNIKISTNSLLREMGDVLNLKEGLIKSYPQETVIRLINNLTSYAASGAPDFSKIAPSVGIDVQRYECYDMPISDIVHETHDLLQILKQSGYYISIINFSKIKEDEVFNFLTKNLGIINIVLEPKYDQEIFIDKYKKLYHISTKIAYDKIQKTGLSPKSQSKKSIHPERIYLALTYEYAKALAPILQDEHEYIILEIDSSNFKPPRYRFFIDPNTEQGIYTYSNIPPNLITISNGNN